MSDYVHGEETEAFVGRSSSYRTKVNNPIFDRRPLMPLEGNACERSRENGHTRVRYDCKDMRTMVSEASRLIKRPPSNVLGNDRFRTFIGKDNIDVESSEGKFGGFIFRCKRRTLDKILLERSFEMPLRSTNLLSNVAQTLKIFFFELEERKLFGIFEIISFLVPDIVFNGTKVHGDSFSIQVQFGVLKLCPPLELKDFEDIIRENYSQADCFTSELNPDQVSKILRLYDPEVSQENFFIGKGSQISPVLPDSYSLTDPQQPYLQLGGVSKKHVKESRFLGNESAVLDLINENPHVHFDVLPPSYSRYRNRSDYLTHKLEGPFTPCAAEDDLRGSASGRRHPFMTSSCDTLDDSYKRIQAARMVNGISVSSVNSAQRSIDWKRDPDFLNSNHLSRPDIHNHVLSSSRSANAVASLQRFHLRKPSNTNNFLDDSVCGEICSLANSHVHKGEKACSYSSMHNLKSTGYKLDASLGINNSQFGNGISPDVGGGISLTHASPYAHHERLPSNIMKADQAVSMAHFATVSPQVSEEGQASSCERHYQQERGCKTFPLNYISTYETEVLTLSPLVHACRSMMLKVGSLKRQTAPDVRNDNQLAHDMEKNSSLLEGKDRLFVRPSQRDNFPTLMSGATSGKVAKAYDSDNAGSSRTDAAFREQNGPLFPNRRFSQELRSKGGSVWNRLSRPEMSPMLQGDIKIATHNPFAVSHKDARGSIDVPGPNNLEDNADKFNVDFSFRGQAFVVNFKPSKSKFQVNEVNFEDGGQGTAIREQLSRSRNKKVPDCCQIRKRRKITRPDFLSKAEH